MVANALHSRTDIQNLQRRAVLKGVKLDCVNAIADNKSFQRRAIPKGFSANSLKTVTDDNLGQCLTAFKSTVVSFSCLTDVNSIAIDSKYAVGNYYLGDRTIHKCSALNGDQTFVKIKGFKRGTSVESTDIDGLYVTGDGNRRQRCTVFKCIVTNSLDAVREIDLAEFCTVTEGLVANTFDRFSNVQYFQRRAVFKGVKLND